MIPQWTIEKKRDGESLCESDIRDFISGYASGKIPDYQMSALAMAIYFQDMNSEEIAILTDAMMRSGDLVDASSVPRPKVDKHSTGGIGDKVSLILAPLAACCGLAVPMISGRGLGITGGTLDKLESIPGYRTDLSIAEFLSVLRSCGCCIIGQTADLAPADKKLYALRDVTGTVPSIPLITASIMSKKLAEGADSLVLDVKWGKGAFMKSREDAERLANSLVEVGSRMGRGMAAILTDMNQPLGRTAGNAVEVVESIETLKGEGPADLVKITVELTALMLVLGRICPDLDQARDMASKRLNSGEAFDKFIEMVDLHGGDLKTIHDPSLLPQSPQQRDYPSPGSGYIAAVDAELIGRACVALGAGRSKVRDPVDHAVGLTGIGKIGEEVTKGQTLVRIHASSDASIDSVLPMIEEAFQLSENPVEAPVLMQEPIIKFGSGN